MNVTLQYGPMTKLLNILNMCLKEQLVTDLRRTEAKLDLDLTNTEDVFQHGTVDVLLGNRAIPQQNTLADTATAKTIHHRYI